MSGLLRPLFKTARTATRIVASEDATILVAVLAVLNSGLRSPLIYPPMLRLSILGI